MALEAPSPQQRMLRQPAESIRSAPAPTPAPPPAAAPSPVSPPAPANARTSTPAFRVVSLHRTEDAAGYLKAWESLAASAVEPNLFYEHWMLLPALELYAPADEELEILLVVHDRNHGHARPAAEATSREGLGGLQGLEVEGQVEVEVEVEVVGVFPLLRHRRFRGLPIRAAELWSHPHCYLCTPLIARGSARPCWEAIFAHERAAGKSSLLELQSIAGDGPVFQGLMDYLYDQGLPAYFNGFHTRAMMQLGENAEQYLARWTEKDHRQNYQRKRRRLDEAGTITTPCLLPQDNIEAWLSAFFELEASGWKGRAGTAITCQEADRQFFRRIAREAFVRNRLRMQSLALDGRTIAMQMDMLAGEGAFSLKIGYDQRYGRHSPGMVLALEVIRQMHQRREVRWIDSCSAAGDHPTRHLWGQRRTIASITCPTGGRLSELAVSLIPLARWLTGRRGGAAASAPARPATW